MGSEAVKMLAQEVGISEDAAKRWLWGIAMRDQCLAP